MRSLDWSHLAARAARGLAGRAAHGGEHLPELALPDLPVVGRRSSRCSTTTRTRRSSARQAPGRDGRAGSDGVARDLGRDRADARRRDRTAARPTWSEDQLLLLDRNGYPEEAYFTFSYSPIRDESGVVRGIFTRGDRDDGARGRRPPPADGRPRSPPARADARAGRECRDASGRGAGRRTREDVPFAPPGPGSTTAASRRCRQRARRDACDPCAVRRDGSLGRSASRRGARWTTTTASSSSCSPPDRHLGRAAPRASRRSAPAPTRSPSSTGRRPSSSPTSRTSSARR